MKKLKYFIFSLVILGSLFFLFGLEVLPEPSPQAWELGQEFLNLTSQNDVIIIFNSGGWGNTPLEKAGDFAPIIEGIQKTLDDWGLNVIVIPYNRTKNTLLGKITGAKDFLSSFDFSSEILAKDLEFLAEKLPDKKIIIAGLSAGGAFADKTMEKISDKTKDSIYAITAGIPFWYDSFESENLLLLDNNGKDTLSKGELKLLVLSLIKTPFKWILAKLNGQNLTFSQAIRIPGHEYSWSSPEVGPKIVNFLENKLH